ncbi:MAG: gamma-glutamylcyclotransferase [Candidatus Nanohaloarchaea archaeon]|nr:gamma-glutamylcyclotransferase [Candidatus Nanohaloarchaea archaeon]
MPWIFAYGSLMWQPGFEPEECVRGVMDGFHRAFNKRSTVRWGTPEHPSPTLGLEEGGECVGLALRVAEDRFDDVMDYLREREGSGFSFEKAPVHLEDGRDVKAHVAVNDHDESYIGDHSIKERARMAVEGSGKAGTGAEYVLNTHEKLESMDIHDPHVQELAETVQELIGD